MNPVSIVVLTYDRPDDALDLLKSIRELQNKEALLCEVILLNNASTCDYSAVREYVSTYPEIKTRILDAPRNLGVAGGRNFAAALARGVLLVFLDDDVVIEDVDFLTAIQNSFKRNSGIDREIGVLGFKVRYADTRELQMTALPHKSFVMRNESWFLTSYYVGCAHAFTREAWLAAGPYPENFFYGMEEYDQSYRVIDAGFAIAYDASVEVFHKESPLGRSPVAQTLRMMWVNKSVVAWRYLPLRYFFSTTVMWCGYFILKSRLPLSEFTTGGAALLRLPFREPRRPVKNSTRAYLRRVKARLWY